jgi:hypothetical protein
MRLGMPSLEATVGSATSPRAGFNVYLVSIRNTGDAPAYDVEVLTLQGETITGRVRIAQILPGATHVAPLDVARDLGPASVQILAAHDQEATTLQLPPPPGAAKSPGPGVWAGALLALLFAMRRWRS